LFQKKKKNTQTIDLLQCFFALNQSLQLKTQIIEEALVANLEMYFPSARGVARGIESVDRYFRRRDAG